MIDVLYVVTSLDTGGAERSLLELIRRLDRRRFRPTVCSMLAGGVLAADLRALDVEVCELGLTPGLGNLRGSRLLPLIARRRPQLIHARLIMANLWARLGALLRVPVVCEERGLDEARPSRTTLANRLTAPLCQVTVANSQAVAHRIAARDRPRALRVIYGGIDVARFLLRSPGAPAEFDVLSVTRLERYKGVHELLEAFAKVAQSHPHSRFGLVGGGRERAALEQRASALGLADKLTFLGERRDVPEQLRRARIFALASHEEGFPNAVLEAMAAGLAVVATRVGGTPEIVTEATGLLVPPRDPPALATALTHYLDDPERTEAHGAAGRQRVAERFSIEATVRAYEQLYFELVQ